ncbi:MAG: hypothetical protein GY753_18300 [Gammaproteobacteria bacterium]|nr:hypothetical protein [Gammaproteobacteria bacterium]
MRGEMLTLIVFLAVICTKIVEAVFEPLITTFAWPKKSLLFIALLVGVALAWFTGANLFAIVGIAFSPGWMAIVITGILIGGSGSVLHDVIGAWEQLAVKS